MSRAWHWPCSSRCWRPISSGRIRILLRHRVVKAATDRDRIAAVTLQPAEGAASIEVTAPYFLDATELGDLLKLSGTEYVVGAEALGNRGELHAPIKHNRQISRRSPSASPWIMSTVKTYPAKPEEYDKWRITSRNCSRRGRAIS